MRQLRGGDHLWFALETDHAPLHFVGAAVYDPSTRRGGTVDVADLKLAVGREVHRLPLRERLLTAPWRLDLPYWIDADDFDIDDHIGEIALRPLGGRDAFRAAITDFLEAPFDRSRPLWEMRLVRDLTGIEDFPDGSFAVLVRVHHGQFDGTTALRLLDSLHTPPAEPEAERPELGRAERTPTTSELIARAPWHFLERSSRAAAVAYRLAPTLGRRLTRRPTTTGAAAPVPRTRFSSHLASSRRVFDFLQLPLDEITAIKGSVDGATVNDVASAIAGGALRRFLQSHDELPDSPLVVVMPVSAHDRDTEALTGNRISLMTATVHTEVADPLERLRKVCAASTRSKRATRDVGTRNIADLIDALPTNALDLLAEPLSRSRILERLPLPFSGITLTNVPGPRETLHFDGARMVTLLGATFLLDGLGLIIAVTSYCDQLIITFTSTPEAVPDPTLLASAFRESFEELCHAATTEPAAVPE